MRDINEVWILNSGGLCLYNHSVDKSLNPALFGGFITAIQSFGQNLSKEDLNSINLGEHVIIFLKRPNVKMTLIGRAKKSVSEKKLKAALDNMFDRFINKYGLVEMNEWNGDLDQFRDFDKEIEVLFKDKTSKTKGMW